MMRTRPTDCSWCEKQIELTNPSNEHSLTVLCTTPVLGRRTGQLSSRVWRCCAATKLLEGTKYVTISLTLPYMYRLIEASADNMLYMPWKPAGQQWLRATQLEPEVRAARKLLHDDFKKRWLEDMPDTQRAELDIATLLDPRFKTYVFPGCTTDLDEAKDTAMDGVAQGRVDPRLEAGRGRAGRGAC